jgi:hypothetical protein
MRRLISCLLLSFFLTGCKDSIRDKAERIQPELDAMGEAPKGELSFLLDYNGKQPEEVGFLSNHIVERRMANLMKDSFQVMPTKTKFASPIVASKQKGLVAAKFFYDKELTDLSAMIIIDAKHEIFWVYYYNGDELVKFTDNPSVPAGGI